MPAEASRSSDWSSYWLNFSNGETPSTTLMDPDFLDSIQNSDTILDLGCGYGRNTATLAERARTVIGIDINAREVAFAALHNSAKNIRYEVMSGTDLDFRPASFDKVVLSGVLGGVSLGMRHQILSQVDRATLPGGMVYASEYAMKHDASYSEEIYRHGQKVTGEYGAVAVYDEIGIGDKIKFIGKHFEPEELAALLEAHHFTDPTIHTLTVERKPLFNPDPDFTYTTNMVNIWAQKH